MEIIWAEQALTENGWESGLRVSIGEDGRVESMRAGAPPEGTRVGALLPAPVNLHSHAFQRAMAGLTERRGPDPGDSFWTWRRLMFRFLDRLGPEDVESIAAFVQMQMLEAGYAAVAEFHYLHHQPGGAPYDDLAELAHRIVAAAGRTGIGLTLLPVFYQQGGCDGGALQAGQIRFGNDPDRFAQLVDAAGAGLAALPGDCRLGVAPHSLRAVSRDGLAFAADLARALGAPGGGGAPLHMHVAEQAAEVEEVRSAYGARPMEWLLANADVDDRWCLIHATQMLPRETAALAASRAVAGLCPITESSLGDGIFDGVAYLGQGGRFGIGSDSNIRIALSEELRTFEYSQRLRDKSRAALATPDQSTGRALFEGAARGGAQAAARDGGVIAPGRLADLAALDMGAVDLEGRAGDALLDAWIFAGDDRMVRDVWSAGRRVVRDGRHHAHDAITAAYRATMRGLRDAL